MLSTLKKLLVLFFFPCLICSCNNSEKGKEQKRELIKSIYFDNVVSELTEEQGAAFDALNTLQTSTDQRNRLYSTFSNIDQPCYPPDTSFEISQSELLVFMKQFIAENCKSMEREIQNKLAETSVLAQKKYTVLHCRENNSNIDYKKGLPMVGTWVLPKVLNRRDISLVW